MAIYAGIDEAGYGPMFGPLVIARTVFRIEGQESGGEPESLWTVLKEAVCKQARDKRGRIAVQDSKKLYSPASGPGKLERGVLPFLHMAGHDPVSLDALLGAVGLDEESRVPTLLWYHDAAGGPALPSEWTADELATARGPLCRAAERAMVSMADMRAAVVFEDRFNEIVAVTRSKANCTWRFVAQHLWEIWERFGAENPWVVVDRLGGRRVYHPKLQMLFEGARLRLLDESDDVSRYHIADGERSMIVSFETGSEERHLPAALASMTAKYVREMLMVRFNRFWTGHAPAVQPTAGYVQDGRRFLSQIEQHIDRLGIDRRTLIRAM